MAPTRAQCMEPMSHVIGGLPQRGPNRGLIRPCVRLGEVEWIAPKCNRGRHKESNQWHHSKSCLGCSEAQGPGGTVLARLDQTQSPLPELSFCQPSVRTTPKLSTTSTSVNSKVRYSPPLPHLCGSLDDTDQSKDRRVVRMRGAVIAPEPVSVEKIQVCMRSERECFSPTRR